MIKSLQVKLVGQLHSFLTRAAFIKVVHGQTELTGCLLVTVASLTKTKHPQQLDSVVPWTESEVQEDQTLKNNSFESYKSPLSRAFFLQFCYMIKWLEILDACSAVCTDTRQISKDCLYISLKGANFNGNTFAQQAIELGAKYAIVDQQEFANDQTIFYVEDGLLFLQNLALAHRQRFQIPVIGITGSNGKTSTKELVKCVLETKFKVLCTEGNLNNHIGVPLTLLRLKPQHEIAIIEMGANKPLI